MGHHGSSSTLSPISLSLVVADLNDWGNSVEQQRRAAPQRSTKLHTGPHCSSNFPKVLMYRPRFLPNSPSLVVADLNDWGNSVEQQRRAAPQRSTKLHTGPHCSSNFPKVLMYRPRFLPNSPSLVVADLNDWGASATDRLYVHPAAEWISGVAVHLLLFNFQCTIDRYPNFIIVLAQHGIAPQRNNVTGRQDQIVGLSMASSPTSEACHVQIWLYLANAKYQPTTQADLCCVSQAHRLQFSFPRADIRNI